jgi:hypothetical protein
MARIPLHNTLICAPSCTHALNCTAPQVPPPHVGRTRSLQSQPLPQYRAPPPVINPQKTGRKGRRKKVNARIRGCMAAATGRRRVQKWHSHNEHHCTAQHCTAPYILAPNLDLREVLKPQPADNHTHVLHVKSALYNILKRAQQEWNDLGRGMKAVLASHCCCYYKSDAATTTAVLTTTTPAATTVPLLLRLLPPLTTLLPQHHSNGK